MDDGAGDLIAASETSVFSELGMRNLVLIENWQQEARRMDEGYWVNFICRQQIMPKLEQFCRRIKTIFRRLGGMESRWSWNCSRLSFESW